MKSKAIYTKLNRHRFMKELLKVLFLKEEVQKHVPLALGVWIISKLAL